MPAAPVKDVDVAAREDRDIDLRVVVAQLWERRLWIVGCVVVFTAIFAAIAFTMTPVYRAKTVLMAADWDAGGLSTLGARGQLGGLASLMGLGLGGKADQTQEALAVLASRGFTEAFIRDEQLMPKLFADRWDAGKQQWKGDPAKAPTLADGFVFFDKSVRKITEDRKTNLITLRIDWHNREEAAHWANELIRRLNAEMRSRAIERTNASIGHLNKELAATEAIDTRAAINRLIEAQINQRMFATVTQEYALRTVDRAMTPDLSDKVRPKRALLLAAGIAAGFVVGVLVILLGRAWRKSPESDRSS